MNTTCVPIPGRLSLDNFELHPNGAVRYRGKELKEDLEESTADVRYRFDQNRNALSVRPLMAESRFPASEFAFIEGMWRATDPYGDPSSYHEGERKLKPTIWLSNLIMQFGLMPDCQAVCLDSPNENGQTNTPYHQVGPAMLLRGGGVAVGPHAFGPDEPFGEIVWENIHVKRCTNRRFFQVGKYIVCIYDTQSRLTLQYSYIRGLWYQLVVVSYTTLPTVWSTVSTLTLMLATFAGCVLLFLKWFAG